MKQSRFILFLLAIIPLITLWSCNQGTGRQSAQNKERVDTFWYEEEKNCPLVGYGLYWNKKFKNKDNELVQQKAEKEIISKFGDGKTDIKKYLVNVPVTFNEIIGPVSKDGSKEQLYMVSFEGDPDYGVPLYYGIDCVVDAKTAESLEPGGDHTYYLTMVEKCVYNKANGYGFNGKGIGVGSGNVYLGSFIGGLARVSSTPEKAKKMRLQRH